MEKNVKQIIKDTIFHRNTIKIPTMYRADPSVNEKMLNYFGLKNLETDWQKLINNLGADNFSNGETLNAFLNYFPKYVGPRFDVLYDFNHFFIWGIKPIQIKIGNSYETIFHKEPPLYDIERSSDLKFYSFPKLEWFDFNEYRILSEAINKEIDQFELILPKNIKPSNLYFQCTFLLNSIFMTSIYLRGIDKMLIDLVVNKHLAKTLIDLIGEFCLEFCKKNLSIIGKTIKILICMEFGMILQVKKV